MRQITSSFAALMLLLSLASCSKGQLSFSPAQAGNGVIAPDKKGVATGYAGDTLRTACFDMTLENPQTCMEFDGLTPDPGFKLLTADLTLYNYTDDSQTISDAGFQILWGADQGEAAAPDGDWPVYQEITDENGGAAYTTKSDRQMPVEFSLEARETRTELLLFQVPEDAQSFSIVFRESSGESGGPDEPGTLFYIRFSV